MLWKSWCWLLWWFTKAFNNLLHMTNRGVPKQKKKQQQQQKWNTKQTFCCCLWGQKHHQALLLKNALQREMAEKVTSWQYSPLTWPEKLHPLLTAVLSTLTPPQGWRVWLVTKLCLDCHTSCAPIRDSHNITDTMMMMVTKVTIIV